MTSSSIALSLLLAFTGAMALTQEGLGGMPNLPSAHTLKAGQVTVSASAHGHTDAALVEDGRFYFWDGTGDPTPDSLTINDLQSYGLAFNAVLGLWSHVDLGFSLPFEGDLTADTRAKRLSGQGFGDPVVFLKAGLGGAEPGVFDASALVLGHIASKVQEGFLPKDPGFIDFEAKTQRRTTSAGQSWGEAGVITTLDFNRLSTPVPLAFHLGGTYRALPTATHGAGIKAQGGVEVAATPNLTFFAGAQGMARLKHWKGAQSFMKEWAAITTGLSLRSDEGFMLDVGIHRSLAKPEWASFGLAKDGGVYAYRVKAQPEWSLSVAFGWTFAAFDTDRDRDGVPDATDACPAEAEDQDGFQDTDGCPEPDNDFDSVPDPQDQCPLQAEDIDGYQDEEGCPDPDNDQDGVLDTQDKCPLDAEDRDGYVDFDGCPELDNDEDGVFDARDQCPSVAEDKDGYQDQDGCPEPDNDGDGIPDEKDACTNQPETRNGFNDLDGCPDALPTLQGNLPSLQRQTVLDKVLFQGLTLEMLPQAYPQLDSLALLLKQAPSVRMEVRGYMDNQGGEQAVLKVSQARADAVRAYLLLKGVNATQVVARGYGSADPIASNQTAQGRIKNRRIEAALLDTRP